MADVAFGKAGGIAAEKAVLKTAKHKIATRQVDRLKRIGTRPGARTAQQTRATQSGQDLQKSVAERAAQAGVVSAGIGSAAEREMERTLEER